MRYRPVVVTLFAATALVALSGCTGGGSQPTGTAAVTTPQADISGEWVVTRTVATSNDASNPARVVGATSVRYLMVDRDDCDEQVCDGTVSSGATLEGRVQTELAQTDGGFDYTFAGNLDCMNSATGGVLVVGGFAYSQTAKLTVGATTDVDGTPTAATLTGTIDYTDSPTADAIEAGCTRDPLTVDVEYTVTATRPPVG